MRLVEGDKPTYGRDGWSKYPALRLGPASTRGTGRIQTQLRRAFIAYGDVLSSSDAYQWCKRRQSSQFGQWERWSITRVLLSMADRVGHGRGRGRPWLYRLHGTGYGQDSSPLISGENS